MDDVHLSTARLFRYELRLGGKFSAALWSAGGVPLPGAAHHKIEDTELIIIKFNLPRCLRYKTSNMVLLFVTRYTASACAHEH